LNQINAVLGDGDGEDVPRSESAAIHEGRDTGRQPDRVKILNFLDEKGGLPNRQVKQALNLSDARYGAVCNELKRDGLVEKYRCRGGGLRLTRKGKKAASQAGALVLEENKGVPQDDPEALKSLRRAADAGSRD
jgi:DNA-binding MarR family transcriptional regulator